MGERRTVWIAAECGRIVGSRDEVDCSCPVDGWTRFEVVPAPGPGAGLYQLTDDQAKALAVPHFGLPPEEWLAAKESAVAVLRAGLDDSDE